MTDSDAQAEELLADPDGVFGHYFRYLRGVAQMTEFDQEQPIEALNAELGVAKALDTCVIAGSAATCIERLIAMTEVTGPFGTLVSVGHDWDGTDLWPNSIHRLAADVAPTVSRHIDQLLAARS